MPPPSLATDVLRIHCPRCGYDLTAVAPRAATHHASERCSECGLALDWPKLLDARHVGPPWCIEYVLLRRRIPAVIAATLVRMARPWKFWSDLTMMHRPNFGRMVWLALLPPPVVYLTLSASIGFEVWRTSSRMVAPIVPPAWAGVRAALLPLSTYRNNGQAMVNWYDPRPRDLMLRYSPNPLPIALRSFRRGIDRHGLSDQRDGVRGQMVFAAMTLALCPAGFALLPFTRRVAKVRLVHLMRIAAYSLVLFALVIALDAHMHVVMRPPLPGIGAYTFVLTMILTVLWWAAACDRYLKLNHPWAVAAAVVTLGLFGARTLVAAADLTMEWLG